MSFKKSSVVLFVLSAAILSSAVAAVTVSSSIKSQKILNILQQQKGGQPSLHSIKPSRVSARVYQSDEQLVSDFKRNELPLNEKSNWNEEVGPTSIVKTDQKQPEWIHKLVKRSNDRFGYVGELPGPAFMGVMFGGFVLTFITCCCVIGCCCKDSNETEQTRRAVAVRGTPVNVSHITIIEAHDMTAYNADLPSLPSCSDIVSSQDNDKIDGA